MGSISILNGIWVPSIRGIRPECQASFLLKENHMFVKVALACLLALAAFKPISSHLDHVKVGKVFGFLFSAMGEIIFPDKTPPTLGAATRDPFLSDERLPLSRRESRRDFRE